MIGIGSAPSDSGSDRGGGRATERDHWIALSLVPGLGPAGFEQLIRHHGSASAAWRAGAQALVGLPRMTPDLLAAGEELRRADVRNLARSVIRQTEAAGGRVVTGTDADYPRALLTLDPRPPTLYLRGDPEAFDGRAVAVVGTRGASGYGLATATELGIEMAAAGVTVVSGLALGIDGAAHQATVTAGGRTIAVLPSPIDRVYPPRHRALAEEIVRGGGALVSEAPIGAAIGRPDFARRNRVIAGLAEAVVVVEAPDRSGALMTAAAAIAIGRELYAVPGPIDDARARGCNRLIADQQAEIVTSVSALMRRVGVTRADGPVMVAALSEVEGVVLRRLLERSGSLEELVDRCRLSPASVASALSLLEVRSLVHTFGGATFHPTLAAKRLAGVV